MLSSGLVDILVHAGSACVHFDPSIFATCLACVCLLPALIVFVSLGNRFWQKISSGSDRVSCVWLRLDFLGAYV